MGNDNLKEIFSGFDRLAVKERADAIVDLVKKWNAVRFPGRNISICPIDRVHVNGIEEFAAALGMETEMSVSEVSAGMVYLYTFTYGDIEFAESVVPSEQEEEVNGKYLRR